MRSILLPSLSIAVLLLIPCAGRAHAQGVPDPRFSTVDAVVVGSPLGIATFQPLDPNFPGFDVVARDVENTPMPGAIITLDFATSGIALYGTQNAGTTIDCANRRISRVTDAQGHAVFAARLGGWQNANLVPVLLNGEELAKVKVRSPDYDGDGRVAVSDLDLFATDYLTHSPDARSDFDLDATTNLGDLSIFAQHYLGQAPGATPRCP